MTKDPVDFVRQGAFISLSMILIQQNDAMNPKVCSESMATKIIVILMCLFSLKVSPTRKLYEKIINDKHEDAMAKFGAVLGQGIIDAGV